MQASDVIFILTVLAGLVCSGTLTLFGGYIDQIAPGWGQKAVALLSIISVAAGLILRTYTVKAGAPATSIVNDAPVVSADGKVGYGTNVSTTSTVPIAAPAPLKGPPLS